MADTTFEEYKRCPKCGNPGREHLVTPQPDKSRVITMICETKICRWYETGWIIQVMADGSIPVRKPTQKDYPEASVFVKNMAARELDTLRAAAEGDEDAAHELLPDGTQKRVPRRGR